MFITGWTDKDGNSISYEETGMFVSPDGNTWSNRPFTKEQKLIHKADIRFHHTLDKVKKHLTRTDRSIFEEIHLINTNKSTLSRHCKDFLLTNNKTT